MIKLLAITASLLLPFSLLAQTGPGGVGNSASNMLWLQAGDITALADDDDITTWTDGSGNSNDVSQPDVLFKPIYKTGILNGFPAVRFNKTNGRIRKTGFANFPTTAITAIYVNSNVFEASEGVLSYATASQNNDFLLFNSSNLQLNTGGISRQTGTSYNDNDFHIANVSWRSVDGNMEAWKDGTRTFTSTGFSTGTSITVGGTLAIAGEQDAVDDIYDAGQAHFGDFTEVMIFNTYLNTAQHIIVNNYLSAKYNLTIANDLFAHQELHSFDVAGIGREDVSNIHTAAMSANVLQIQNASGLDVDQEYLLFGHDDTDITTTWTTTEAPNAGVDYQRLAREWRIDETGDVGTVDFIVDVAAMPALPVGHTMYALMVDSDGDFSSGAAVYELGLVSGTEYDVTGIDINDGDYVAIAAVNPKIEHTITASSDFETTNASIEITLNFIARTVKTVDVTTADVTALAGSDYTALAAATISILAGNTTANYAVIVTDDGSIEDNETFTITLSSPSAGIALGINTVHTYSIQDEDNPIKVFFATATSSGDEGTTPAVISLEVNSSQVPIATVDYTVTGGTATGSGTDFTLASGTASFATGTTTSSFNIAINDDALFEISETIIITLSNPFSCNLDGAGILEHTFTITDNDPTPSIQFNSTSSSGSESVASVSIQADLSVVAGIDASATYTVTGTATGSGIDYTLADGTITIPEGSLTANISANVNNDITEELSETIIITLSVPVNSSLGANTVHTYTILDDADEFGHLGPGGVGISTTNKIWMKSNDLAIVADGTDIITWSDASGNSNDFTQANTSFSPRYYANVLNGQPVVRFEQANGRLIHNSFDDFPTTNITTIAVNKNLESGEGFVSYASVAFDNDYLLFNSSSLQFNKGSTSINMTTALNNNQFKIVEHTWQSSDGDTRLYVDGTQEFSGTHGVGANITPGGNLALAGEQDGVNSGYSASQAHFGDFTEFIMYNQVLNSSRRKIVDNYLSSKYGITIANDLYAHDAVGTHENEVTGIGRDDISNFHKDAQGTSIIRINTPSSLDDGDYLFWGHDNTDITAAWTTTEAPNAGVNIQRMAREWRFNKTNDVGSISAVVDVAALPALPASHTMYVLMIDADGDFSSDASVYQLSLVSGTTYDVNTLTVNDGDFMAIGVVNPRIEHSLSTSSGFETGDASIEISTNFIASTATTVEVTTADVSALAGSDYTSVAASVITIPAGNTTASYAITIVNDVNIEDDEAFTATLANPSAGVNLGTNTVHTYTIQDDDNSRKVFFNLATSSGSEGTTPATIALGINILDNTNITSVDYTVTDGTATGSGTDYTLATGTVSFPINVVAGSFNIAIIDDVVFETNETIIITLSNPINCNLDIVPLAGAGIEHTYTITENDLPPTIQFNATSSSGLESVTSINFQVDLSVVSGLDASAAFTVTGTAIGGGVDYTLADGTINISEGSLTANVSATIINDGSEELPETMIITLSGPTNSTLGANTVHTYTITNDGDVFGHLGPGGIGIDANNKLWVKSNDLAVVADGTDITTWADASGNSNDFTQGNTSFTPRYYANVLNGQPVVRFEQANGRLVHNTFTDFPTTSITTIIVNSNAESGDGFVSYATTASNNDYLLFGSNNLSFSRGSGFSMGTAINGSTFRIIDHTWQSSDGDVKLYLNGTQEFTGTHASEELITAGGTLALAGEQDAVNDNYDAGQAHFGDFTEFILYNEVINSARRKIVDNYLSSKYGIAIANDMYAHDALGTHEYEVAGIGRDDVNNFHSDAQGPAIVRINTASSLDDGDYLLWGHDNSIASPNTADVPVGVDNRLERAWRVNETGDVGTVTVNFDLSAYTIGDSNDLVLLIDSDDGAFANSSQFPISSFSSNIATFNTVDFASGNWFTIASTDASTALPIALINFDANENNNEIDLKWSTASELNNDFYTLERSSDTDNWKVIATIDGAGNSNKEISYVYTDKNPLSGLSYYRLKQTDFDGEFEYFNIVSVNVGNGNVKESILTLFPNPVLKGHILNLEYISNQETSLKIELRDIMGRKYYAKTLSNITGRLKVGIPIDESIPQGVYFIISTTDNKTYSQKVIVE